MTLGGLALAIGILVDHAIVAIENINVHLELGKDLEPAILDGAQQITIPAFVSTICICIVFVPMFFLTGVGRYLFVPLAEAVVFAMIASWALSRTLLPTMANYMLKAHEPDRHAARRASRNPLTRGQAIVDAGFSRFRLGYRAVLEGVLRSAWRSPRRSWSSALGLVRRCCPGSARTSSRRWTRGQFKLHLRAPTGTRIEETAVLCDQVEAVDPRASSPPREMASVIDNIGMPLQRAEPGLHELDARSARPTPTSSCRLRRDHGPTCGVHARGCAASCPRGSPACMFTFVPADIVSRRS